MRKIYFTVDENNRLNELSSTSTRKENEFCIEVDDNHEVLLGNYEIFKYENGELIKDEEYQEELIEEEEERQNKPNDEEMNAIALMELTELIMGR